MNDVHVGIDALDSGLDIMTGYEREIEDLRAHVTFEIRSLIASIEREKFLAEADPRKRARFAALLYQTTVRGEELLNEWKRLCGKSTDLAEECRIFIGKYIRKLNLIGTPAGSDTLLRYKNAAGYYVVIVDSRKYPQTAEHIKAAQTMGLPEFVTLRRKEAPARRDASLSGVETSPIYDRDEWPMAIFEEGGEGANVAYVNGHDNRGAGSFISWQLRNIPDGARIRVRVI